MTGLPIFRFLCAGGEDDDRGSVDICRVLAAISHILHSIVIHAADQQRRLHPRSVPRHLLARHVELHVQPYHLLLDELPVRPIANSMIRCY
jgi:hypothetical protein